MNYETRSRHTHTHQPPVVIIQHHKLMISACQIHTIDSIKTFPCCWGGDRCAPFAPHRWEATDIPTNNRILSQTILDVWASTKSTISARPFGNGWTWASLPTCLLANLQQNFSRTCAMYILRIERERGVKPHNLYIVASRAIPNRFMDWTARSIITMMMICPPDVEPPGGR